MKPLLVKSGSLLVTIVLLAACGVQMGEDSARTPVTGSAGGASSQNANAKLEHCDQSLGTLAVIDRSAHPAAGPTIKLFRGCRARPRGWANAR